MFCICVSSAGNPGPRLVAILWSLRQTFFSGTSKVVKGSMVCTKSWTSLPICAFQVDYILGNNNRGQSYLVGFGSNYPQRVHHRASSIVSYKKEPQFVTCKGGYTDWYNTENVNPNLLVGALVGGPDQNDDFVDQRNAYAMTEPATYNTAPLVGVLARLQGGGNAQGSSNALIFSFSTLSKQSSSFAGCYPCAISEFMSASNLFELKFLAAPSPIWLATMMMGCHDAYRVCCQFVSWLYL